MKERFFKYYDELPPPIAERAKRNFEASHYHIGRGSPYFPAQAVMLGFEWRITPEGSVFWQEVHGVLIGYARQLPSVKGLLT